MNHPIPKRCRGAAVASRIRCLIGAVLMVATVPASHAADDPYLEMLDEEVSKVEAQSTDTGKDGASHPAEAGKGKDARELPSRMKFEELLREQHVGTYSFYRRLPERSREEVFLDYSRGASMEAVREKVIERYLHP